VGPSQTYLLWILGPCRIAEGFGGPYKNQEQVITVARLEG